MAGLWRSRGESSHVERSTDVEAPTLDAPSASSVTGVVGDRRHADQGGNLAAIEFAELGQLGDERGAGDGANALGRAQQHVELAEVFLDMADHLALDLVELGLDGQDHGLDARTNLDHGQLHSLAFRQHHRQQLASTRDERSQVALVLIGHRPDEIGQIVAPRQRLAKLGQHPSVNRVGLGQSTHRLGEVSRLLRVDDGNRQPHGLKCARQRRLIATGGLHHHQSNIERFQGSRQRRMAFCFVVKTSGCELTAQNKHIHVRLRDVDAHH